MKEKFFGNGFRPSGFSSRSRSGSRELYELRRAKRERLTRRLEARRLVRFVSAGSLSELEAKVNALVSRGYLLDRVEVSQDDFFRLFFGILFLGDDGNEGDDGE